MEDGKKYGRPWQDDELEVIVADYFAMLAAEIAGEPYVKARHSAALMVQIGRSHRSVEFKHQNISAVLNELGLPWIPGYIPKSNYQNSIFGAIDRYLTSHTSFLESPQVLRTPAFQPSDVFVDPPPPATDDRSLPEPLQRLVRKFDPVERDRRNRALGSAGEAFVLEVEQRRLANADRADLAKQIRWVAQDEGDGAGYDILSYNLVGRERLIEVKTTNGAAKTPFFISRNERDMATERAADWCLYRVHLFAKRPQIFTIFPPLENTLHLRPEIWRASF